MISDQNDRMVAIELYKNRTPDLFKIDAFVEHKYAFRWILPTNLTQTFNEKLYNWMIDPLKNYLTIPKHDATYRNLIILVDI